jgi:predicted dehydrogenase
VPIIRDCLSSGAHVIAEKPLAPTVAELDSLLEDAGARGRLLIENHNYRFNAPVLRMETLVAAGHIGDVREVEVRMCLAIRGSGGRYADANLPHPSHRLPAGVIHEFLPHMCYVLLRFLGGWDRVRATWSNHGGGTLFSVDDLDALVVRGPAHGRLRFSCSQYPDCFSIVVRGTAGMLETDLFQPHVAHTRPRPAGAQLSPVVNQISRGLTLARAGIAGFGKKVMQITPYEGLGTFLDRTYQAIASETMPPVTPDDVRETARLIEALVAERGEVRSRAS